MHKFLPVKNTVIKLCRHMTLIFIVTLITSEMEKKTLTSVPSTGAS